MDEHRAQLIAEQWSGGRGLVPRGPRQLLAYFPATPGDVERHTGRRPDVTARLWRLEIGGRFLQSRGLVYPGGVPYPEDLHSQTAVIANEVWLYVDQESGRVLGSYWWPDAIRRPVASPPRAEYAASAVVEPSELRDLLSFDLELPTRAPWQPLVALCTSPREAVVFCVAGMVPDPLNEMVLFEEGGLSLRAGMEEHRLDVAAFLDGHSPPYRRLSLSSRPAVGREPGRALGPQTWPWPGELRWWNDGVSYELKGFAPLATLQEVAASMRAVTTT